MRRPSHLLQCHQVSLHFSQATFSRLTSFPFPVTVSSYSKSVKLLKAHVRLLIFTIFSSNFLGEKSWQRFSIVIWFPFPVNVYSSFFFKICQTVACISMIRHFHEFFLNLNFWRDFDIRPNCGRASEPARTEIFNYVRHVCCCNKVLFFRREQRRSCCPWQHQHQ